jgi:GT2 family glycosyltransferase
MTVTVVIATHNRAALLAECLAHLARLRFLAGDEVIVVDNASTDDTPTVIDRAAAAFPVPLRHLHEAIPGKTHALARAIAQADGDVLAFTDDDVNVDGDWLDAIRDALGDPRVALVGGAVEPRWERQPPHWLHPATESYGVFAAPLALIDYGSQPVPLGVRTVLGANMAIRRRVLIEVGGFARHLGKLSGTLLSGEDHDVCRRIQTAGYTAMYAPRMRVRHWVPADRMRLRYYLSWFFWSGITNATLDRDDGTPQRTLFRVPRYVFKRLLTASGSAVASACRGNTTAVVARLIDVAYACGYTARCWHRFEPDRATIAAAQRS